MLAFIHTKNSSDILIPQDIKTIIMSNYKGIHSIIFKSRHSKDSQQWLKKVLSNCHIIKREHFSKIEEDMTCIQLKGLKIVKNCECKTKYLEPFSG